MRHWSLSVWDFGFRLSWVLEYPQTINDGCAKKKQNKCAGHVVTSPMFDTARWWRFHPLASTTIIYQEKVKKKKISCFILKSNTFLALQLESTSTKRKRKHFGVTRENKLNITWIEKKKRKKRGFHAAHLQNRGFWKPSCNGQPHFDHSMKFHPCVSVASFFSTHWSRISPPSPRRETSTLRIGSPDRTKSSTTLPAAAGDKLIKAASPPPSVLGLWFCLVGCRPDRWGDRSGVL